MSEILDILKKKYPFHFCMSEMMKYMNNPLTLFGSDFLKPLGDSVTLEQNEQCFQNSQ